MTDIVIEVDLAPPVAVDVTPPPFVTIDVQMVGLPGPPGPPGTGEKFQHFQNEASDVWTVNHNFGYRPLIQVFTSGGVEIIAGVIHLSNNTAQIQLDSPMTGLAIAA